MVDISKMSERARALTYNVCFWNGNIVVESVYTSQLRGALFYRFRYKCRHKITQKTLRLQ